MGSILHSYLGGLRRPPTPFIEINIAHSPHRAASLVAVADGAPASARR